MLIYIEKMVIFFVSISVIVKAAHCTSIRKRQIVVVAESVGSKVDIIANEEEDLSNNIFTNMSQRPTINEYLAKRKQIVAAESAINFESDVILTDREILANQIVMNAKNKELNAGLENPFEFIPSRHFFEVMDKIKDSKLFQIISKMPKGAVLHGHDTALVSIDFIMTLTYKEHLWQLNHTTDGIISFKFSRHQPIDFVNSSTWTRVADERARIGRNEYDAHLRSLFSLYTDNPRVAFKDINDMWRKFMGIFILFEPLVTYKPVWKEYFRQTLVEMAADGVQYLEFRGLLPQVYDLDGNDYSPSDIVKLYIDVLEQYKLENPDFIGSKFIYAPLKAVPNETIVEYIKTVTELHLKYPDFIAGFDLVGQEDTARNLVEIAEFILKLPESIKFFFHAGETNWFGKTDENLIDAILLGSTRIGHGYALAKHPTLLELVKEKDIAIEVNPISNQVLKLVDDLRNHPCSLYFANNVPLVISSDDPAWWEAKPLSHDFYMAFLGIASSHSDLRTLKKLATNSIKYSSLNAQEKKEAYKKWQPKWDAFIEDVIATA